MRFLTRDECIELSAPYIDPDGRLCLGGVGRVVERMHFENAAGHQYFARAQQVVESLGSFDWCLLCVVLTDVWSSNENLQLYYRFRESYGDRAQIMERPGLVALHHELVDLVSFVQLGMLFGWEMYLVTSHDDGRAFISHDGYYDISQVRAGESVH